MIGWSVEVLEFDIRYETRGAIKPQCLADFSAKLTPQQDLSTGRMVYADGSSNKVTCGAEVVLEGLGDLLLGSRPPTIKLSRKPSWPAYTWHMKWDLVK